MQTYDKARNAVALAMSPVVRALVEPDGAMSDIWDLDSLRVIFITIYQRKRDFIVWLCTSPFLFGIHQINCLYFFLFLFFDYQWTP